MISEYFNQFYGQFLNSDKVLMVTLKNLTDGLHVTIKIFTYLTGNAGKPTQMKELCFLCSVKFFSQIYHSKRKPAQVNQEIWRRLEGMNFSKCDLNKLCDFY